MRFEQQNRDFYGVKEVRAVNFNSKAPGKEVESSPGMNKLISHMEKMLKALDKLGKKVGLSSDSENDEAQVVQRSSRRNREVRPKRKSGDGGEFKKSEPKVRFPDYSPSRERPRYDNRGSRDGRSRYQESRNYVRGQSRGYRAGPNKIRQVFGVTSDLSSEESVHDCSEEESEREEAGSHPLNE